MTVNPSEEKVMTTLVSTEVGDSTLVDNAGRAARSVADAAAESFKLRRAADGAIEALEANGLTKMTAPLGKGGQQASMATQVAVFDRLAAEGDGSLSWVASIYNAVGYMICAFGDEAVDEYLASDTPRSAGVFSVTGKATRVPGGYRVSGKWAFASGQHHAGWILVPGLADDTAQPLSWLVPKSEFTVEDDWYVSGLVATGSNAVSLRETFVPDHRTVPFADIVRGKCRTSSYSDDLYYRQPFVPVMCAVSVGTPVGLARAALRLFTQRIERRGITYTPYSKQAQAPITHFQLAEAQIKLDQAEFHTNRLVRAVDEHIRTGTPWDITSRVRCRADIATAVKLAREVCDIVELGSGASAIHTNDPLPGILRDIRVISVHSFLLHSTNAELYGRVLAGMDPGVPFV